jgi:GT2 family glycosyltransferase
MRYLLLCDAYEEQEVLADAAQYGMLPADRIIVLSSHRKTPAERNSVLELPIKWALKYVDTSSWRSWHRIRRLSVRITGLRGIQLLGGIDDLFTNIDASDPDVIDLRKLGSFGRWLGPKCRERFPGRRVLVEPENYVRNERDTHWRVYDSAALVSIVLPVHNGARYLSLSIESCLKQSHQNIELIIVDDASSDESPAIIRKYAALDTRIVHVRNEINRGLPESLNAGFSLARGNFLTWTSDDNLYERMSIEYMVQQLCTFPEVGLVYCGMRHIDEAGRPFAPNAFAQTLPPARLAVWNIVGACFMYRREVMEAAGPYRPRYRYIEDFEFFLRACIRFPARFCYEPCYFYRIHSSSLTNAHSGKWKRLIKEARNEHLVSGRGRIRPPSVAQLSPNVYRAITPH